MEQVTGRLPNTKIKRRVSISFMVYGQMLNAMYGKNFVRQDVVDATGLSPVTVRRLEQYLMREQMIHIVGWLDTKLAHLKTPMFRLGPGEHKPKPILGREKRMALYNERRRHQRAAARHIRLAQGMKR